MKYIIITTTTDANGNVTTTTTTATDAKQARDHAITIAADGASVRVYPDTTTDAGQARGAVMVMRRTAANGIKKTGGNDTQRRIERETAAINARIRGAETAERIISVVADYSPDTQDYFDIAVSALSCTAAQGMDIAAQYSAAYAELNRAIHAQRAATAREISTEFIRDGGGDLVAVNRAIAWILRGSDKWTPTDGGEMDAETAARLDDAIHGGMTVLTPTQRDIFELLARGYSQRRISAKIGRELATVNRHVAILRGKLAGYIRDTMPDFAYRAGAHNGATTVRVDSATTAATAAAHTMTVDRHANTAERKTQNAERARRYRERKAAERNAQKGE